MNPYTEDYLNSYFKKEYYEMTRRDIEWEVKTELQLMLWRGAALALMYKHHRRSSNIDDAPVGAYVTEDESTGEEIVRRLPSPEYSYVRDTITMELRQRF